MILNIKKNLLSRNSKMFNGLLEEVSRTSVYTIQKLILILETSTLADPFFYTTRIAVIKPLRSSSKQI